LANNRFHLEPPPRCEAMGHPHAESALIMMSFILYYDILFLSKAKKRANPKTCSSVSDKSKRMVYLGSLNVDSLQNPFPRLILHRSLALGKGFSGLLIYQTDPKRLNVPLLHQW
jgi:hypothetical protein